MILSIAEAGEINADAPVGIYNDVFGFAGFVGFGDCFSQRRKIVHLRVQSGNASRENRFSFRFPQAKQSPEIYVEPASGGDPGFVHQ